MPTPNLTHDYEQQQDFVKDLFRDKQIAAEVPAVRLSRAQWEAIQFIITELGDLVDDLAPVDVEDALIQGKAISKVARKAWGLKHSLGL